MVLFNEQAFICKYILQILQVKKGLKLGIYSLITKYKVYSIGENPCMQAIFL